MGMETLKDDLVEWIADTVAMWMAYDGSELTEDLIENAILQEMDSLKDDMYDRIGDIQSAAKDMVKDYTGDE